jgi:nitrous oxide reductase
MYSNHKAPRRVSRRVVLGTAAGAGAVGAGAALGLTQLVGDGKQASNTDEVAEAAGTSAIGGNMEDSPVVVYVDGRNGPMRIFAGTDEREVSNQELLNLIWRESQQ